jgi:hypothetical protein
MAYGAAVNGLSNIKQRPLLVLLAVTVAIVGCQKIVSETGTFRGEEGADRP